MGDRFIHDLASSCGSHSNKGTRYGSRPYQPSNRYGSRPYQPSSCRTSALCHNTTMDHVLPELWSSGVISDAPLSPSHAGDKGDSAQENTGLRPVDAVVLPRPSSPRKGREEGKASVSVPSKIVNTNGTTINGVQVAKASIARVTDNLFTNVNFSSDILTGVRSLPSLCSASNASQEENSTFKWYKRTLYQFQNSCGAVSL